MKKISIHSAKAVITLLSVILLASCGFDKRFEKVDGNGTVLTKSRSINQDFKRVHAGSGIEVIVEQSNQQSVTVIADENLHKQIRTEVKDGILHVTTEGTITNAKSMRVTVQMPVIEGLEASSAAMLKNKGTLKADTIDIIANSSADLDVTVDARSLHCESSSAGHLKIKGKAGAIEIEASSSSEIDSRGLNVNKAIVEASSAAEVYVNPTDELLAEASSSSDIYYTSTPASLSKKTSSGGSISKQ